MTLEDNKVEIQFSRRLEFWEEFLFAICLFLRLYQFDKRRSITRRYSEEEEVTDLYTSRSSNSISEAAIDIWCLIIQ